jgi:hypothetical protein
MRAKILFSSVSGKVFTCLVFRVYLTIISGITSSWSAS